MKQTKPVRIGILGEIRAGKDTVSQLIDYKLYKYNRDKVTNFMAFSTGIHEVLRLTMPEIYTKGKPRKELQHTGQALRELKPDVWIDFLFNSFTYRDAIYKEQNILVTDVRQPNEVKRLQEAGFTIIKVTASKEARINRAEANGDNFDVSMFDHETEKVIHECPYDYLIDNSYAIDFLEDRVDEILEEVLRR
ncbi:hypothetical protein ABEU97_20515 [Priestia megaterium]